MASELTDEHIALLEAALDKIENEYKPTCIQSSYGNGCAGAVDADVDFWRRAVDCVPSMLIELRTRRAREKALVAWADESTRRAEAALCAVAPRSIREVELQMKVATIKAVLAILEAK